MNFQSYSYQKNHWSLEPDLRFILKRYWPAWEEHADEFERFGDLVGGRAYEVADHVDQYPAELVMVDLDG